jgi:hypothetical protein
MCIKGIDYVRLLLFGGIFNGKTFMKDKVFYNKEISDNKKGGYICGISSFKVSYFCHKTA